MEAKRGYRVENLARAGILGGFSIFAACGGSTSPPSESNAGSGSTPAQCGGSGGSSAAGGTPAHSGGSSAGAGSGASGSETNTGGSETNTGGSETNTGGASAGSVATGGVATSGGCNSGGTPMASGGAGGTATASGGAGGTATASGGAGGIDAAGGGSTSAGGESGSGGIGGDSCLKSGKVEITSFIDGHDKLTIGPDALEFLHLSWAGPGMESFRTISTRVVVTLDGVANALDWCPEWPDAADCNTCDGSCGELRVFPIASAPLLSGAFVTSFGRHFLPAGVSEVTFACTGFEGRDWASCALVQNPGSGGPYVIDFNDDQAGGPASYTATLSFQFDSCSQGEGGSGAGGGGS